MKTRPLIAFYALAAAQLGFAVQSISNQSVDVAQTKFSLRVRAYIDGHDYLLIRGNKVWYRHVDWNLPGNGDDYPTYLNDETWNPTWNGSGNGAETTQFTFSAAFGSLPTNSAGTVLLENNSTRCFVSISSQPSPDNNYTLELYLSDPQGGAEWCDFTITYEDPSVTGGTAEVTQTKFSLSIRAYIDGEDYLLVRGNEVWYQHLTCTLPGKGDGKDYPTYLGDEAWNPTWNGSGDGAASERHALPAAFGSLPTDVGTIVSLENNSTRCSVSISSQPSQDNDYTLAIFLSDVQNGAAWCDFTITYSEPITITNVAAQQCQPCNGKVDIAYTVTGDLDAAAKDRGLIPCLKVTATDRLSNRAYTASSLSGDIALTKGTHSLVWDMAADGLTFVSTAVVFSVSCETTPATYCVIDLSNGASALTYPVTYLGEPPEGGFNADEYKTTKLVLRRIEPGTFIMQNSQNVTLTRPFYIGLFEVTQKQYALVTGSNPSDFSGDMRPVEKVSYNSIRGSSDGAKWPSSSIVDSTSFLGKLRARASLDFDLPTEAQWEYACRAGTTTTYSYGDNVDGTYMWYVDNSSKQTHDVGMTLPNNWGLYDMHGNVAEWCLDWYGTLAYGTDPKGPSSGATDRALRGGGVSLVPSKCTSSFRGHIYPFDVYNDLGFRLARSLKPCNVTTLCVGDGAPTTINFAHETPDPDSKVEGYADVYDGAGHGVTISVSRPVNGASVKYALSENGPFSAEKPLFTNVCNQMVWVEISAENYRTQTNSATVLISPRPLAVIADAKSKIYGDADPALTYTTNNLVMGDTISGELVREAGENAGTYAIQQGTLTAGGNYDIAYSGATFTICKATLLGGTEEPGNGMVTEGGLSKFDTTAVYDGQGHTIDTNVLVDAFTAAVGDEVTVQYAVGDALEPDATTWASVPTLYTNAGEYVVWYRVSNPNYEDFVHAAKVFVSPRPLAVIADAKSKIYGDADPALTYATNGLVMGDTIMGELEREAGEAVGQYAIKQGTLTAGGNYAFTFTGATFTVCKATLLCGDEEPGNGMVQEGGLSKFDMTASYDGTGHTIDSNALVAAFSAAVGGKISVQYAVGNAKEPEATTWASVPILYTNAEERVVWYRVSNPNYEDFDHAVKVIISPRPLAIVAGAKTKNQGEADPPLTYSATGLVAGDAITGILVRDAGESVGTYAIRQGTLTAGDNYEIAYSEANLVIKPATYTVAFAANGGTGTMAAQTVTRDVAAKLRANAFTRTGYAFAGWARSAGGAVAYANGASVKNLAAAGGSVTLYAKWTPRPYKVAFAANGGTLPKGKTMAAQAMTYGTAAKLRANAFTRSGYVFAGWAKSAGGAVAFANTAAVKNLSANGGTVTLYAKWAKATYKVAFYANGGTGKMAVQTFKYGTAAKLRANAFTRKDCVFIGWAKTPAGAVAYKNAQAVKNLVANGSTVKLYARWAKKTYRVSFNANGGTLPKGKTMAAQTFTYGKAATLRGNAFTRAGYTFAGWARSPTGAVAYRNAQSVGNLTTGGAITLYAKWAKK